MRKITFWLFALLFFLVPLVLWPFTSEVFEFNKMVLVYIFTVLIIGAWVSTMIIEKKLIFRRTILDKPLLIFLGSQLISTILSIDPLTSWLGYYSRFNGGFVSILCYSLLYWAFVSNFDKKDTLKIFNYSFLPSATIVSLYGVAEHFGIDKNIWVQDVQSRIFSTLGQPNWLASWLTALIPITWALMLNFKIKDYKFWIYFSLSVLFFWTIIFTKSRSGLLGFASASVIFWGLIAWINKKEYKKYLSSILLIGISIIAISLVSGTELTPSIKTFITPAKTVQKSATGDTALETGGTESGTIRRIVWKGAVDIWRHYPVFGTGVETFAFSYYKYRPIEHNETSEWDFIYNKAHNEFLNTAANTGTVGLLAYLAVIVFSSYIIFKKSAINFALLAGYISLSVTNFFGFSVVPTQLEFYLFPALAVCLALDKQWESKRTIISGPQKLYIGIVSIASLWILYSICTYWIADTNYAKGLAYNSVQRPDTAINYFGKAISAVPNQPLYYGNAHARSDAYAQIALAANQAKNATASAEFIALALNDSNKAVGLSPANVNLKRVRFGLFIMLSAIDPKYLINARDTLVEALNEAPNDPKLYYNLGLIYARTGQADKAIEIFKKTIELKTNYRDPRLALAYLLIDKKQFADAKAQLEYILQKIDPNDSLSKQALESIK